jgi:membrane protein YdbS with pleckstrin-like domain
MKYFLQWLVNDIKTSWAVDAESRARMWGHFLDVAKFLVRIFSAITLIVSAISIILITAEDGRINWVRVSGVMIALLVLNGSIFLAGKLRKFRSEKDQLVQMLKE